MPIDDFTNFISAIGDDNLISIYNRLKLTGSFEFALTSVPEYPDDVLRVGILYKPSGKFRSVAIPRIPKTKDAVSNVNKTLYKLFSEFESLPFTNVNLPSMDPLPTLKSYIIRDADIFKDTRIDSTPKEVESPFESAIRTEIASRGDFVVDIPKLIDVLFKLGVMVPKEDIQNPNKFEDTEDKEPW